MGMPTTQSLLKGTLSMSGESSLNSSGRDVWINLSLSPLHFRLEFGTFAQQTSRHVTRGWLGVGGRRRLED